MFAVTGFLGGLTTFSTFSAEVVLLIERGEIMWALGVTTAHLLASLLLTVQPIWRTHAADPYAFGWSGSALREHPHEAILSDALKLAYRVQPFPEYLQAFARVREMLRTPRGA